MRKSFLVIAVATALTSTFAAAAPGEQRFVRDGETYVYTSATDGSGATVLDGRRTNDGMGFHLVIKGTDVRGVTGGQPVSFRIAKPITAAPTVVASK